MITTSSWKVVNLLSLSLRNPRRLILARLHCMGASARESRVSVAIYSFRRCGLSGLASIHSHVYSAFVDGLSPGPRKNDFTIYWALGPFGESFISLVDPGDIYPPQCSSRLTQLVLRFTSFMGWAWYLHKAFSEVTHNFMHASLEAKPLSRLEDGKL
jgi:hypothetical protein